MQLHPTSRSRRVRRLLAVSAAAVAVMIAPTACNYGGAAQMDMPTHSGHMDGMNMDDPAQPGAPEEHRVVPVANQVPATAAPAADDEDATTTAARSADRRRGDSDRRRRGDQPTTSATIPAATGGTTDATSTATAAATESAAATETAAATVAATSSAAAPPAINNGLDVLGRTCAELNAKSKPGLPDHTGFQSADAQCVSTEMGAVAAEKNLPSLLITGAPRAVRVGQAFKLQVSTRNLVRDRFLGAAAGGYYLESSFLNAAGLQRGHFHTACRNLSSTRTAPEANKTPDFFLATQDGGGGATPDTVTIKVPGIKTAGVLQCTSWAGDGSHRTPMMSRANETPAIDSVRIFVIGRGQQVADDAAASAAVAPAADTSNATADAAADAAKQAQAEQQQAGAQKPDQSGAVQQSGDAATADAGAIPAPADAAPATSGAPAGN